MAESRFSFTGDARPVCEIGISAIRQAEPTSWLDVSCFVHEAELFRGRERFNERFEPGTASVTFANDDGWADLGGTYAEVAAAELRPGRQIRIGVHGAWNPGMAPFVRWLYRGFIDQATPAYDPVRHDTVTVNCIDALGESGQTTTPTAAMQGINETVAERINRVLDAVGWWGSKRKIDATTTKVQGTELGGGAVDHMSQAADSAGGVVFGDLDGDVVFRDIDWMLYDPDTPPDGTIGPGDPGAPPGDTPPYINPTAGPVYDPDDPPTVRPPKVCVCADGTAGTLIEKGDNYRLYVRGGHLFYESSGHTWDLGPYSGGCTCVEPPGGGGGGGPVRTDDGLISPFPPVEMPPAFAVELLAFNDANTDVVVSAVTVAGVHPGHDCLLVVMINAIGDTFNTAGLAPVVTGGGLDWAHRRAVDMTALATSEVAVAAVGRSDPGTFSVVATWAAPQTSRTHIVTVWKVTAAADDYLERFDAGSILYALTATNPPEVLIPGNGPFTVPLYADREPAGAATTTRTFDITIAQSLADDEHGPYGADFDEATGPWITPTFSNSNPALRAAEVCDTFDRADGPLGAPDYATLPADPAGDFGFVVPYIVSNHVEWDNVAMGGSASPAGGMRVTRSIDGAQAIEVTMSHLPDNTTGIMLMCQLNDTAMSCVGTYFNFDRRTTTGNAWQIYGYIDSPFGPADYWDQATDFSGTLIPDTITVRMEADADGHCRSYYNGTLILDAVVAPFTPHPYVGWATGKNDFPVAVHPWVESVCTEGAGITRKCSWVAGWRQGVTSNVVGFADVNYGDDDLQSTQAALVLEPGESTSGHRLLGYGLRALTSGVTAAGALAFNSPPRPGALVVVFVGVTASADVLDSISVTGADFTRSFVRTRFAPSWGQGAVYVAVAPLDMNESSWNVVVGYPAVESISAAVYEVTLQDDTVPVGVHASNVLGTNTAGSVNGASTITLTGAGDAAATVLAFIHVAADASGASGASAGSGWTNELVFSPSSQRGYMQTMSRPSGSTSTAVAWADVQTGTAATYSAVQLAVEIHPYDGLATTPGGSGVYLGGVNDPFNGTITSAGGFDPVTGFPIWGFP